LIGAAIEKITGRDFSIFVKEVVFDPLKMNDTRAENRTENIPNRTQTYDLDKNGKIIVANNHAIEFKIPSGGFLSTAEDLVKFGLACLKPGFFSKEILGLFFTPQKNKYGEDFDVGIGWMISPDEKGRMRYGHLGGVQGGCSMLVIFPDTELVIAFNGNRDTDWSDIPTQTIAEYFLEVIETEN
jgi:CubicO group peptidase (beta-lactamase class C family)